MQQCCGLNKVFHSTQNEFDSGNGREKKKVIFTTLISSELFAQLCPHTILWQQQFSLYAISLGDI